MQIKSKTYRTSHTRQRPVRIYNMFDQWIEARAAASSTPDSKANFSLELNRLLAKEFMKDKANRSQIPLIPAKFL